MIENGTLEENDKGVNALVGMIFNAADGLTDSEQTAQIREMLYRSYCCDGMRNAVGLGAIKIHQGRPEVVTDTDEATNEHFPLRFCPFCGMAGAFDAPDFTERREQVRKELELIANDETQDSQSTSPDVLQALSEGVQGKDQGPS